MRYADPLAQAEIDRLRAGEDPTPPTPGEAITSGQLWYLLLEAGAFERLRIIDRLYVALEDANRCYLEHSDGGPE